MLVVRRGCLLLCGCCVLLAVAGCSWVVCCLLIVVCCVLFVVCCVLRGVLDVCVVRCWFVVVSRLLVVFVVCCCLLSYVVACCLQCVGVL